MRARMVTKTVSYITVLAAFVAVQALVVGPSPEAGTQQDDDELDLEFLSPMGEDDLVVRK